MDTTLKRQTSRYFVTQLLVQVPKLCESVYVDAALYVAAEATGTYLSCLLLYAHALSRRRFHPQRNP
jgi:hypothetical protein